MHGGHRSTAPVKTAVLNLPKLTALFHQAAFWLARARNTHIRETAAWDRSDWHTSVARVFTMGQYEPTVREIIVDFATVKHEADRIAKQMVCEYLERLHLRGPAAAHAYARSIAAKQSIAEQQVMAIWQDQHDLNALTADFAGKVARGLNYTILTCEVAMALITCWMGVALVGAAAAPVLIVGETGMSAATAGTTVFGIGTAYNLVSKAVAIDPGEEPRVVAIDYGKDAGRDGAMNTATFAAGKRMDGRIEAARKAEEGSKDVLAAAKAKVIELQERLAGRLGLLDRAGTYLDKLGAQGGVRRAAANVSRAELGTRVNIGVGRTIPVVQCAYDLFYAFDSFKRRAESVN